VKDYICPSVCAGVDAEMACVCKAADRHTGTRSSRRVRRAAQGFTAGERGRRGGGTRTGGSGDILSLERNGEEETFFMGRGSGVGNEWMWFSVDVARCDETSSI
jgi:hypothetical protein